MQPFIGSQAVHRGALTRHSLARDHRAIFRDVYLPRDVELTAQFRAQAAWLACGAPLCGLSAAALFGTKWLDPTAPAEILRANRRAQDGIVVRSWAVDPAELCLIGGITVTTPARTVFDIGRTRPAPQAIPIVDAVLNATRIKTLDVAGIADAHRGVPGEARLRTMLEFVDGGAESPQESRLRLLLVRAGMPTPQTQIEFRDLHIRVDMGWPDWRVAVEYDGVQHWTDRRQRSWDIDRIALLEAEGWTVIRVSAELLSRPQVVIDRVVAKLRAAGCPI
ncbi:DUF559 domain-containing protein [Mycobacterium sp. PDNC021]|uniref:DUF559 domain-containing protein n=1 Tax=Mycobacterium sp. PDNC021 TaxID=3391399 RepID=UPI003AABE679